MLLAFGMVCGPLERREIAEGQWSTPPWSMARPCCSAIALRHGGRPAWNDKERGSQQCSMAAAHFYGHL